MTWDSDERRNPFPGLRAFEPDEDHLFFGREEQIDELLSRLRRTRFLSVVGTSGSGKSSLIRSGLIPSLYSGFMAQAGSSWRVAVMRPGSDPIGNLAAALGEPDVLGSDPELAEMQRALLETTLHRSAKGLVESVRQARLEAGENLLILADQFEELFRFKQNVRIKDSKDSALAFVKLLLAATQQDEVPLYVVLTMRSDFIGNCTEFPGLAEAINDGQYLVPRMSREERKAAIVGPVAVSGAEITPRLVLRLLNDVGDDPDQLPILQHALMRTWDYWDRHHGDDEPIDLRHYEATGTMQEALSQHAEEAYRELGSAEEQRIAELMFKALTDGGTDARGVRRPSRLAEICGLTDAGQAAVVAVIERFRAAGRSFLMPPAGTPLTGETVIDISHESLMRTWTRLIEWVDEETRSAQLYRFLSKTAMLYQEGKAALFRDPELQIALNWKQKNQPTETWALRYDPAFERAILFLKYSEKERHLEIAEKERQRQRQLRMARRMMMAMTAIAVIILVFGMFSLQQSIRASDAALEANAARDEANRERDEANRQKLEVERQRQVAEVERAEADKQRERAQDEARRAEEERRRAREEQRNALEQRARAEQARQEAVAAEREAQKLRAEAERQRADAEAQRSKAVEQERRTKKLEMVAVARALALQTPRLRRQDQDELAALLSLAAFQLYERGEGRGDDPAVFQALLSSSQRLAAGEVVTHRDHLDAVRSIALGEAGQVVYSGSDDGTVRRYDARRPEAGTEVVGRLDGEVRAIAVDGADRWLAIGGLDGSLELQDLDGGRSAASRELALEGAAIRALKFAPQGPLLAVGDAAGDVALWDTASGAVARSLPGGRAPDGIGALSFDPAGERLAAAAGTGGALVWTLEQPTAAPLAFGPERDVSAVAWSHDGRQLLGGTRDGLIVIWNARGNAVTGRELRGHRSGVSALAAAGRPRFVASASLDGTVMLWDLAETGGDVEPLVLADNDSWVWALTLTPDGERVIAGGADRSVRLWPTRSRSLAEPICDRVRRNLTPEEWAEHLPELEYRETCAGLLLR